tara:strand:+ start:21 stop:749 length:729 start_codon:yes stop_codon:yes gene_type:complete
VPVLVKRGKKEIEEDIANKLKEKIKFSAVIIGVLSILGFFQFESLMAKNVENSVSNELELQSRYVNKLIEETEDLTIKRVVSLKEIEAEIPRLKQKVSELQKSSLQIARDTENLLENYKQFGALDTDEITTRVSIINSLSDEALEVHKIRDEFDKVKDQLFVLQEQLDKKEICRLKIKSNLNLGTDTVIVDGADQKRGTPFTYTTKVGSTHTVTVQSKKSKKKKTFNLTCDFDGESVKFVIR